MVYLENLPTRREKGQEEAPRRPPVSSAQTGEIQTTFFNVEFYSLASSPKQAPLPCLIALPRSESFV